MKRELKANDGYVDVIGPHDRKAHPDEKGTESFVIFYVMDRKAFYRKAHPDEKGTESGRNDRAPRVSAQIARPIPMKRELKALSLVRAGDADDMEIARPIPMKRELKELATDW